MNRIAIEALVICIVGLRCNPSSRQGDIWWPLIENYHM